MVAPHDAPVIHSQTGTEVRMGGANPSYRREESDEPLDRYRLHEVPGAAHGIPAPRAERGVTPSDANCDANGNAIGGVRTPYTDEATGSLRVAANGCGLAGSKSLMSSGQLAERHPTHAASVSQLAQRTQVLVREGWLLAQDASTIRREAAEPKLPLEAPLPWRGVGGRRRDSRRRVASRSSSNT